MCTHCCIFSMAEVVLPAEDLTLSTASPSTTAHHLFRERHLDHTSL